MTINRHRDVEKIGFTKRIVSFMKRLEKVFVLGIF